MKTYTISVDSSVYSSGDINNRVYYFDFTKLPKCRYSVDWTFMSTTVVALTTVIGSGPVCVHMDNFSGPNQFQARDTDCPTHAYFGALKPEWYSATDGILSTDLNTNSKIILDSLPSQPFFTVKLRYGMGTSPPANISAYVMTIELIPLDEDYEAIGS